MSAMLKLIARRLAVLPLILLAVAAVTFVLTEVSPFDPVDAYVGAENNVSPERTRRDRAGVGLRPAPVRAVRPLVWNLAQGDMGNSIVAGGQPVAGEIAARVERVDRCSSAARWCSCSSAASCSGCSRPRSAARSSTG